MTTFYRCCAEGHESHYATEREALESLDVYNSSVSQEDQAAFGDLYVEFDVISEEITSDTWESTSVYTRCAIMDACFDHLNQRIDGGNILGGQLMHLFHGVQDKVAHLITTHES